MSSIPNRKSVSVNPMRRKENKNTQFLIFNKGELSRTAKQEIAKKHQQLFDYKSNGKVANIKYHQIKYDLDQLFEKQPAFYEPIINYNQLKEVPKKLELPYKSKKVSDIGPHTDKVSEHELKRQNNSAYADICLAQEETTPWKYVKNLAMDDQIWRNVITRYKYDKLKQPVMPMTIMPKREFERLKKLAKQFKQKFPQDSKHSYFMDYSALQAPVDIYSARNKKRRHALTKGKRNQIEEEHFSKKSSDSINLVREESEDFDSQSEKTPKKKGPQLPKYFYSHILKSSRKFEKDTMLRILNGMNIDLAESSR